MTSKKEAQEIITSVKKEARAIEEIGVVLAPLESWQRVWVLEAAIRYVQMKDEDERIKAKARAQIVANAKGQMKGTT